MQQKKTAHGFDAFKDVKLDVPDTTEVKEKLEAAIKAEEDKKPWAFDVEEEMDTASEYESCTC